MAAACDPIRNGTTGIFQRLSMGDSPVIVRDLSIVARLYAPVIAGCWNW